MMSRWRISLVFAAIFVGFFIFNRKGLPIQGTITQQRRPDPVQQNSGSTFQWSTVPQKFSVTSINALPTPVPNSIPKIQHNFKAESKSDRDVRLFRLHVVKGNFTHAWEGYKRHGWLRDEVKPLSGDSHDPFGGWAATLVDSLDTLWIMGMKDEFQDAVNAIGQIDFSTCALDELNVFETTIRYLGGFLSAYDLSGNKYPILIQKATELGDMLYKAFDTPNRLPIVRWKFKAALEGASQEAHDSVLVSEPGSLTLEFTRLSQVTGEPKYYDAVQRVMDLFDRQQDKTKLPGMWPVIVNLKGSDVRDYGGFTIGGMADSLYEYLPKQHILLGGGTQQYRRMYEYAIIAIKRNIFYRPMTQGGEDIRLAGNVDSDGRTLVTELNTRSEMQHLSCFAGGMVAIASKVFENGDDLILARKLVEGCLWAYEVMPLGIMPEIFHTVPCGDERSCPWDEQKWHEKIDEIYEGPEDAESKIRTHHLPPGVVKVDDARYILRPEAIESVFILYRITGDPSLPERAWNMFNAIIQHTFTDIAHAGLDDCTVSNPPKADRMESFWMAETLKYFYLIFSEPHVVSLDEYVLNTEAHPLKRPT
ncbi:glycoside hydrolase [Cadophora sp. MPI-SDFR-AT-0126]|nr:glycoside hydrolase [Leotiomycetes sp. MPI-SDFR-AT-0126]